MFTLYILYSKDHNTIYTGETSNLIQRFYSHNFYGHDWSKRYRPWIVIYCEYFLLRTEAKNREKQLKGGKGREWIWNKIKDELDLHGFISALGGRQFKSAPRYKAQFLSIRFSAFFIIINQCKYLNFDSA